MNACCGIDKLTAGGGKLVDEYLQTTQIPAPGRPPEIISYAVWLYYRFNLSHQDIEDLLAERGVTVSYETIRLWCIKFGPKYSRRLKRKHQGFGEWSRIYKGLTSNLSQIRMYWPDKYVAHLLNSLTSSSQRNKARF